MFNEKQKMEYIEENKNTNLLLQGEMPRVFRKTESMEIELGKDISAFTMEQIVAFYKSLFFSSLDSLIVMHGKLSRYASYMLRRNLLPDNQNHFEEIDYEILNSCINIGVVKQKVITREKLLEDTDNLLNPGDKFLCLGFFEGICGKAYIDFAELKMEDFDGNEVHLASNRTLIVSDLLVELAKQTNEEMTYYMFSHTENPGSIRERKFDENDEHILKRKYNSSPEEGSESRSRQRIYHQLARIKGNIDSPAYTVAALTESGRIDFIKKLMKEQDIADLRTALKTNRKAIEYRYGNLSQKSMDKYILKYGQYFEEA